VQALAQRYVMAQAGTTSGSGTGSLFSLLG
jgi:hypothetical protein